MKERNKGEREREKKKERTADEFIFTNTFSNMLNAYAWTWNNMSSNKQKQEKKEKKKKPDMNWKNLIYKTLHIVRILSAYLAVEMFGKRRVTSRWRHAHGGVSGVTRCKKVRKIQRNHEILIIKIYENVEHWHRLDVTDMEKGEEKENFFFIKWWAAARTEHHYSCRPTVGECVCLRPIYIAVGSAAWRWSIETGCPFCLHVNVTAYSTAIGLSEWKLLVFARLAWYLGHWPCFIFGGLLVDMIRV